MMTHDEEGLLVKPRDAVSIAVGISRLIKDPKLRKQLSTKGTSLGRHYSWDNVGHRVLSYYERLLYEHQQVAQTKARRRPALAGER